MIIQDLNKNLDDERKAYIIEITKHLLEINGIPPSITILAKNGIPKQEIDKLFGNLMELYKKCKISIFRRDQSLSNSEMKEYIKSIAIINPITNCWITDKLSSRKKRIQITYKINNKFKNMLLYRLVYLLFKEPLIKEQCIRHTCDNPSCFNPEHLIQGTFKQNTQDMIERGRVKSGKHPKGVRHGLTDPYNYLDLITYIKSRITISLKDEWLYPFTDKENYANIKIKNKKYRLHRLVLANKLGIKYEDIELACHKFPIDSKHFNESPAKNDVNPDHLYNGNASQNAQDTLTYRDSVKLSPDIQKLICEEAEKTNFSKSGASSNFDLKMAIRFNVSIRSVRHTRTTSVLLKGKVYRGTKKRPIVQLDKMGNFIQKFESATDAAKFGFNNALINNVLRGKTKSHKGFCWRYQDE